MAAIVHPRSRARAHAGDDRQALGEFLPQGVLLERPMLARVIEDCLALRRAQHARDVRTTCVRHMPCARYVHSMRLAYTRHWRETRDVCSRSVTYARHTCGDATKAVKCGLVSRPVVTSLTMRRSREKSTRSPGADAHGVVQGCTLPGQTGLRVLIRRVSTRRCLMPLREKSPRTQAPAHPPARQTLRRLEDTFLTI